MIQALRGYRVSEDAVILAWFAHPKAGELVLDAGTGCGVIAFSLVTSEPSSRVIGVEIQETLASRADRGRKLNNLESKVQIIRGDIRKADSFIKPKTFDAIVCNPPYYEAGSGKVSRLSEKAISRHQTMMPPLDLFRVSAILLNDSGRLCVIYPAGAVEGIQRIMKGTGFKASRMLWIYSHEGAEPGLVCIEACLSPMLSDSVENSLVLYDSPGIRTRDAEAILSGKDIHI